MLRKPESQLFSNQITNLNKGPNFDPETAQGTDE
jgi:hypothetical protein